MLTTLVVNNPTDTAVAAELSLRQAVAQANTDAAAGTSDTITFDPSLGSHTITLTQGQLELKGAGSGTITIDGSSPSTPLTIDGGSAGRIFQIDSGVQAVLTNLVLQDGRVSNSLSGGAILNSGTLTMSNSTISGNAASGSGGGVENSGSLVLSNDVFSSNDANTGGGGVDNDGGSVTASDCTFTDNFSGASGGAISNENLGTLTVGGSTFSADHSILDGGAINNSATATLSNDIFVNLPGSGAATSGGAIDNQGALTLTNSLVSGCDANSAGGIANSGTALITNSTISDNNAGTAAGGGIDNLSGGTLTLTSSTISGNDTGSNGLGGGGIENSSGGTLTVSNSTISGNSTENNKGSGGGIENQSGGTVTVADSTISGNSTVELGGGINNAGTLTPAEQHSGRQYGSQQQHDSRHQRHDHHGQRQQPAGNLGQQQHDRSMVNNSTTDPPGPGDVFSNAPLLSAVGNYGGPTQTLALLAGSPAIAAGNAAAANIPATDQRGLPRLTAGKLDIGAFQTQAPGLVFTTLGQTALAIAVGRIGNPSYSLTITVQLDDLDGNPAAAGSRRRDPQPCHFLGRGRVSRRQRQCLDRLEPHDSRRRCLGHVRIPGLPAGQPDADRLGDRLRLGHAAGNRLAGGDQRHSLDRYRRRPHALGLFHRPGSEQPGNHHVHGL